MPEPRTLDLGALDYEDKHVRARRALVHTTPECQVSVYILEPGGRVPSHHHTASWDISLVLAGEIDATFTENGTLRTIRCRPDTMNLVPPGTIHEIANPSGTTPARFLLIQAPAQGFDFVPT